MPWVAVSVVQVLCSLVKQLLSADPTKRVTAEEASEHPFFSTVQVHGNQALNVCVPFIPCACLCLHVYVCMRIVFVEDIV